MMIKVRVGSRSSGLGSDEGEAVVVAKVSCCIGTGSTGLGGAVTTAAGSGDGFRKVTSAFAAKGVGPHEFVDGLKRHSRTASIAFSSRPYPTVFLTWMDSARPSLLTMKESPTVPPTPAFRASSEKSG